MSTDQTAQDPMVAEATRIGTEHGRNAASYVWDGNTDVSTYRAYLKGSDDGDPMVLDAYNPPNLSGEFADDYDETSLRSDIAYATDDYEISDEAMDDAANAYNDAASEAFYAELERVARVHVQCDAESDSHACVLDYGHYPTTMHRDGSFVWE